MAKQRIAIILHIRLATTAIQPIAAHATIKRIRTQLPQQQIIPAIAIQPITAAAAQKRITQITRRSLSTATINGVRTLTAHKRVRK
jgi:hypothetical protein